MKILSELTCGASTSSAVAPEAVQRVVKGVVGDPAFGEDCDLYEAMGYVRKSERKSGLSRKKAATPAAK